jgi:hypothetical protein
MYGLAVKEYIFHNMNRPLTQPPMTHDPSTSSHHPSCPAPSLAPALA